MCKEQAGAPETEPCAREPAWTTGDTGDLFRDSDTQGPVKCHRLVTLVSGLKYPHLSHSYSLAPADRVEVGGAAAPLLLAPAVPLRPRPTMVPAFTDRLVRSLTSVRLTVVT